MINWFLTKVTRWEEKDFQHIMLKNLDIHMQKNEPHHSSCQTQKLTLKPITDLSVKFQVYRICRRKQWRKIFETLGYANISSIRHKKHEKLLKLNFIKMECFGCIKGSCENEKKSCILWKICTKCMSDNGLIPRIHQGQWGCSAPGNLIHCLWA